LHVIQLNVNAIMWLVTGYLVWFKKKNSTKGARTVGPLVALPKGGGGCKGLTLVCLSKGTISLPFFS
jgi:hypothetical protein